MTNHLMAALHDERVVGLLEALVAETRAVRALLEAQAGAKAPPPAPDASPIDPLLGLRELVGMLGVDERTLRRWRTAGELPPPTLAKRSPRWARSVIDTWLARRGAA